MNGDAPDEYALADEPESEERRDDQPEAPKAKPPRAPGQPLPRMWKAEPDDESDGRRSRKRRGDKSAEAAKTPKPTDEEEPGEKKALVEETPVFDTYEARQRARMITGGLLAAIVGLGLYLGYQWFPKSPFPDDDGPTDEAATAPGPVEPALPNLDVEARAMYVRAREFAKIGRTDEAVALLEKLVKSYKNTKTAVDAREALKRPSQNLPMFLDRPTVKAAAPATPAPAPPAPPPVVVAKAPEVEVKGNATLIPPTNPAEPAAPGDSGTTSASNSTPAPTPVVADHKLPSGFTAHSDAGVDPSGWPLVIVGDRDGAPMVFIPGGVFTMGDDRDATFASPEHKVNLAGYYIDQHEVTVRQFRLFLAETNYRGRPPGNWSTADDAGNTSTEPLPIVMVNAADAKAYAEWAGKRLPTEAQWELAARSSDGRVYPWGNEPARYARPRSPRQIDPVMSFPEDKSAFGVFDMGGNVYEWTADSFDPGYYRSLAGRVVDNPAGALPRLGKTDLVVKGGKSGAGSAREPMSAEKRLTYLGFRCALPIENAPFIPTPAPEPAAPEPSTTPRPTDRRPAPVNVAPPPVPF